SSGPRRPGTRSGTGWSTRCSSAPARPASSSAACAETGRRTRRRRFENDRETSIMTQCNLVRPAPERASRRAALAALGGRAAAACALVALTSVGAAPAAQAQGWKPTQPVLYTIPAGPGGALDQSVRMIKNIADKRGLIDKPIIIENRPGGAGRIALAPLDQHPGDPHYLSVITYSLLTNHISGQVPFSFEDYTPLAMLFGEYVTLSVRRESPVRDGHDLVERLKK